MYHNKDFLLTVYSRIRIEFSIVSFIWEYTGHRKPAFWHIARSTNFIERSFCAKVMCISTQSVVLIRADLVILIISSLLGVGISSERNLFHFLWVTSDNFLRDFSPRKHSITVKWLKGEYVEVALSNQIYYGHILPDPKVWVPELASIAIQLLFVSRSQNSFTEAYIILHFKRLCSCDFIWWYRVWFRGKDFVWVEYYKNLER